MVAGAALYIARVAHDEWRWQGAHYDLLRSLKAGFSLAYFRSRLGPPVFSRLSPKHRFQENTFRGRDYWVQTISRRGIVELFAVTSCQDSFHPTFTIPGHDLRVELRRSRLQDIGGLSQDSLNGVEIDYYMSGATASSHFYEGIQGANPGYYKSFLWGVNDACPGWEENTAEAARRYLGFHPIRSQSQVDQDDLEAFRQIALVNTYAETAPGIYLPGMKPPEDNGRRSSFAQFRRFGIGADRILIRTTE